MHPQPEDPDGPFDALEWPKRLYDDVDGKNKPDDEDSVDGRWKRWGFQFSKREPFMLKADWLLGHQRIHYWLLKMAPPPSALKSPDLSAFQLGILWCDVLCTSAVRVSNSTL